MQQKSTPDEPTVAAGSAGRNSARLEDRYATALYELAQAGNAIESVSNDLSNLIGAIDSSADLSRVLQNPVLNRAAQANALGAIAAKLGMSALTTNFLKLVATKGRQAKLPAIITTYRKIAAAARGELLATVRSATPLTAAQQQQLAHALASNHDALIITLDLKVDPQLLGGFSVQVGTTLYDRTLSSQLNRLLLKLKEAA